MALSIWDAVAKIAGVPLYRFLADRTGRTLDPGSKVRVYAGGGYYYPQEDEERLSDEIRQFVDLGYTHAKIKIGGVPLTQDLRRIEAAARMLAGSDHLAVDAIYSYELESSLAAAAALLPYGLWWFEDICDPLDFENLAAVASRYQHPIAAGEALFSAAEAKLLYRHGGLRSDRDILLFDPVHCYGIPGYLQIIDFFESVGWPRTAFWPHGGHLFCLHVVAALGLGGAEVNPLCFQPFGGHGDRMDISDGIASLPEAPGIGHELRRDLREAFRTLLDGCLS